MLFKKKKTALEMVHDLSLENQALKTKLQITEEMLLDTKMELEEIKKQGGGMYG